MSWLARKFLLIIVGLLIVESNESSALGDPVHKEWWETTLVYEIWTPSFQDSDGDTIGDFQGIINRLDYLKDLGIQTICLNQIFESPPGGSDFGISDYENVNDIFGNLSDFDELVEKTHARDIKIILDVEPNHTSDKHKWFEASENMTDPFKDYYIWANGTITLEGVLVPPFNQTIDKSDDISSGWSYNENRKQWYHYTIDKSEPDLNLENSHVQREIMHIFSFWLDRGVDGFRITGVPYFFKDFDFENDSTAIEEEHVPAELKNIKFLYKIRSHVDQWTRAKNSSSKYLITGSYDTDDHLLSYYDGKDTDTMSVLPSNYCLLKSEAIASSSASELEKDIEEWLRRIPFNESTNWMLSSSNTERITSKVGADRLDAVLMLSMLLPGQAFVFYGDEIGLVEISITLHDSDYSASDSSEDHEFEFKSPIAPMQWDSSPSAGFTNVTTENPAMNNDDNNVNVAKQLADPHSHLNVFKKLAKLREDPVFCHGDWEIENMNDDTIFVLRRTLENHPTYLLVINLAETEQIVDMSDVYPDLNVSLDVVVTSGKDRTSRNVVPRNHIAVLPNVGIVLRSEKNETQNDPETNDSHEVKESEQVEEEEPEQVEENEEEEADEKEGEEPEGEREREKVEKEEEPEKEEKREKVGEKEEDEEEEEDEGTEEDDEDDDEEGEEEEGKEKEPKEEKEQEEVKEGEEDAQPEEEKEQEKIKEEEKQEEEPEEKEEEEEVEGEKTDEKEPVEVDDQIEKKEKVVPKAEEMTKEKEESSETEEENPANRKEQYEKENDKSLEPENEETNEDPATEISGEIANKNNDDVVKTTHENPRTNVDSTFNPELRRPTSANGVSAGKSSEIAYSNLIILVSIANYIIARIW